MRFKAFFCFFFSLGGEGMPCGCTCFWFFILRCVVLAMFIFFAIEKEGVIHTARCKRVLTPAAAIANLELEEAELLNRLRSTQEKQRLAYRSFPPQGYNRAPVCCVP